MNTKSRNNSIDLFRLICAILVVVIHTEPFYDNAFGFFLKEYVARIAVPFFLVVAGYFYFSKLRKGEPIFGKYLKKTVTTYAIWSIPYFLINFWVLHDEGLGIVYYIKKCVVDFFVYGSYYHFWFFVALIYAVIVTTLLYKAGGIKLVTVVSSVLYLLGCLGSSYYNLGLHIPGFATLIGWTDFTIIRRIFMTGIPFFALGGMIGEVKDRVLEKGNGWIKKWLCIVAVLYLAEKAFVIYAHLQDNVVLTVFLYPLTAVILIYLLNHPMLGKENISNKARLCANFMYYMHPAFILIFSRLCTVSGAILFPIAVVAMLAGGWVLGLSKMGRKLIA